MLNNLTLTRVQNWLTPLSHTQEGMLVQDLKTEILTGLIIVTEYLNNQDVAQQSWPSFCPTKQYIRRSKSVSLKIMKYMIWVKPVTSYTKSILSSQCILNFIMKIKTNYRIVERQKCWKSSSDCPHRSVQKLRFCSTVLMTK